MPRRVKGYSKTAVKIKGKWYGRLRVNTPNRKTKDYTRQARSKSHAYQIANELAQQYVIGGADAFDAESMTFADLAAHYCKARVVDPIYDNEIKVAGMQAKESAEKEVKALLEYWGAVLIQKIRCTDIERFKIERLRTPVVHRWREDGGIVEKQREEPRKMASVNHELRRMRAMLNFAKRQGWITFNPFNQGESLISEAAEIPRDRGPRPGELDRLLAACHGRRQHMRAFILCIVDTALRVKEARRLTKPDIDLERMLITVRALNSKTNRQRFVPITDRLADELRPLLSQITCDEAPIFGAYEENKSAWRSIRAEAGSEDLQLRDFRHWGTTQLVSALAEAGLPWQHGMAATGHTQIKTYLRYINKDETMARQTGEALRNFQRGGDKVSTDAQTSSAP